MDKDKTVGKQIVQFERVAPGILIPLDNGQRSYFREKYETMKDNTNLKKHNPDHRPAGYEGLPMNNQDKKKFGEGT